MSKSSTFAISHEFLYIQSIGDSYGVKVSSLSHHYTAPGGRQGNKIMKNKLLSILAISLICRTSYASIAEFDPFLAHTQKINQMHNFFDVIAYGSGVVGAVMMGLCIPLACENEEVAVQKLVDDLNNKIEKRREILHKTRRELEQTLHGSAAGTQLGVEDRQRIMDQLHQVNEEEKSLDSNYQEEYARIPDHARFVKVLSALGAVGGGVLLLRSLLYHAVFKSFMTSSSFDTK